MTVKPAFHFGVQGLDGELRAICGTKSKRVTIWKVCVSCKRCLAMRKR